MSFLGVFGPRRPIGAPRIEKSIHSGPIRVVRATKGAYLGKAFCLPFVFFGQKAKSGLIRKALIWGFRAFFRGICLAQGGQ